MDSKDELQFNYIKHNKVKNPSLIKLSLVAGIYWALLMILITGFASGDFVKKLFIYGISGLSFAGIMYIFMRWFTSRVSVYKEKNFLSPIPNEIGEIITQFPINKLQIDTIERKLAIGGILFIGNNGIAFIPHRFNWLTKPKTMELYWSDIKNIYRGTGSIQGRGYSALSWFFNKISYQMIIETESDKHSFSIEYVDQVVDDLNELKVRLERTGNDKV